MGRKWSVTAGAQTLPTSYDTYVSDKTLDPQGRGPHEGGKHLGPGRKLAFHSQGFYRHLLF